MASKEADYTECFQFVVLRKCDYIIGLLLYSKSLEIVQLFFKAKIVLSTPNCPIGFLMVFYFFEKTPWLKKEILRNISTCF